MTLTIRRGICTDAEAVADMNIRMALETEQRALDPAIVSAGVRAVLEDSSRGLYFIAEKNGQVAGQTMVTFEWSDWRNGWIWWIQSVYVKEEFRRQGIFSTLYQHIVQAARAERVVGIRLYVEEHNHTAQQTYQQLGMTRMNFLLLEQSPL